MEEIISVLARCPLFSDLEAPALAALLPQLRPVRCRRARGEAILRPGERPPGVGVVLSGSARVVREDFWGGRALLSALGPGDLFAEAFVCAGVPSAVRVEAVQDVQVLFLPAPALLSPPPGGEGLPARLLELTARKNLLLNRKIHHLSQRTTRAKVLSYLSWQAELAGSPAFTIPLDRQELADYLAVDRSALSAQLSRLRREGVLEFRRSWFYLRQRPET